MDLSVILCTYNRCDGLAQTLATLARQRVSPNVTWEVLVVDNNSSDKTVDVYERCRESFPASLRYVFEDQQGLSRARNRGIAEAAGRHVAFAEDDELADENWLQSIFDTFQKHNCDAVAGKIELQWQCPRPAWMSDDLLGFLGYLDYGCERFLTKDTPPFGGNMAFRAEVFKAIGGFDTRLGRQGRKLVGGEEIDLYSRFLNAGMAAVYQPKAVVHHIVDENRLTKSYFRRLHFNEGRVKGERSHFEQAKLFWGVPMFLFPQLFRGVKSYLATAYRRGFKRSLREEMTVWYFVGFIFGCFTHFEQQRVSVSTCRR